MNINDLLPVEIWLHIAEISPQSYIGVRSVNASVRSYTNEHIDRYKEIFGTKKVDIAYGCFDYYTEMPNGLKNGPFTRRSPNGDIMMVCHFSNGVLDGKMTTYYNNGNVETECWLENDLEHGERKEFAEDGRLKSHYIYERGNIKAVILQHDIF